ncbi:hypothetical protein [Leptotrichia sp. oral taxon 847]|uniref:hypothetical protein n=1 Tax=Leptotrichia sp. oral taxon 847 TaxID=1785996 RepID=UPI000B1C2885|nr:hypothetical protein [Leptotrichia sp. oral taxon 847]
MSEYVGNEVFYFKEISSLDKFNQRIRKEFCVDETFDGKMIKIQIKDLIFGVYFLKDEERNGNVLVIRTDKMIDCGKIEIFEEVKNFYSDLYFLIFYSNEKTKYENFEKLLEKIGNDMLKKSIQKIRSEKRKFL